MRISDWSSDVCSSDLRIILTHTNAEVRDLNQAARDRLRDAGELGTDVRVSAERGAREFAGGDRIMFLKNERGLGVKNGTLGQVERVSPDSMAGRRRSEERREGKEGGRRCRARGGRNP